MASMFQMHLLVSAFIEGRTGWVGIIEDMDSVLCTKFKHLRNCALLKLTVHRLKGSSGRALVQPLAVVPLHMCIVVIIACHNRMLLFFFW